MPSWVTEQVTHSDYFANEVLNAYQTRPAANLLGTTPKLRLSRDPAFNPTPQNTIADLAAMEADFTGYTAGGNTPNGMGVVRVNSAVWAFTGGSLYEAQSASPFVPNVITGYWLDDGVGVVAFEKFPITFPVSFSVTGDYLTIQLLLPLTLLQQSQVVVP